MHNLCSLAHSEKAILLGSTRQGQYANGVLKVSLSHLWLVSFVFDIFENRAVNDLTTRSSARPHVCGKIQALRSQYDDPPRQTSCSWRLSCALNWWSQAVGFKPRERPGRNDLEDQTCLLAYSDRKSDTDKLRRSLASSARKMQVEIRAACPSAARYSASCSGNPRKG